MPYTGRMPDIKKLLHELPAGDPDTGPVIPEEVTPPSVVYSDLRQLQRLPRGYKVKDPGSVGFDPRVAYELALGVDSADEIFSRYNISADEAVELLGNEPFIRAIKEFKTQVQESGITFKLKAKIQAEDLLTHSYQIATDPDMPPAVRADMIKWTANVAELGPKKDSAGGSGGAALTLAITFAGDQPPSTMVIGQPEREAIENGD